MQDLIKSSLLLEPIVGIIRIILRFMNNHRHKSMKYLAYLNDSLVIVLFKVDARKTGYKKIPSTREYYRVISPRRLFRSLKGFVSSLEWSI